MQSQFYISHNGEEMGPFSKSEIAENLKSRKFWETDYVYIEEKADWMTLAEFQKLFMDAAASATSSAVPSAPQSAAASVSSTPVATPTATPVTTVAVTPSPAPNTTKEALSLSELQFPPLPHATPTPATPAVAPSAPTAPMPPAAAPLAPTPPLAPVGLAPTSVAPPPLVTQTPVTPSSSTPATSNTVKIVGGVGTLDLTPTKAETLKISLQNAEHQSLPVSSPAELTIRAAQATHILLKHKSQVSTGETVTIELEARDAFDNVDANFNHSVKVTKTGSATGSEQLQFTKGKAQYQLSNLKAESTTLTFENLPAGVQLPVCVIEFIAGPAVHYVVEAPSEVTAGERVQITIKAVDAHGNVATNATGTVELTLVGASFDIKKVS